MTTLIVNYTELRFTSEVEMTRYLSQTEEIWNDEVMAMLLESGLQSKTVTQICNQSNKSSLALYGNMNHPMPSRNANASLPRKSCHMPNVSVW